jgi:hypothetical protein
VSVFSEHGSDLAPITTIETTMGTTAVGPAYKHRDSESLPDTSADWILFASDSAGWVLIPHYMVVTVHQEARCPATST